MAVDTFSSEKEFLKGLLEQVQDGRSRLPDFQRGWVWPDKSIISLLSSVSLGFPVGTVMMLRTGGATNFVQRPVEGAELTATKSADRLILDGQQRLTSLFQALVRGTAITTIDVRKNKTVGWFYIDVNQALDPHADREESIRFIPEDKIVRNFRGEILEDYSTPDKEYAAHLFPLNQVFSPFEWQMGYQAHWEYDKDRMVAWNTFFQDVIQRFGTYQVPVIELGAGTPKQAVCQVFEKVNTGGVTLTVFELLTATFAADDFRLRTDWDDRKAQWADPSFRILREVQNTDFLQAVTLLATRARREAFLKVNADAERAPRIGCKRSDILELSLEDYKTYAPMIVQGMKAAAKFLHEQSLYDTKFLPYGSQLIPLSAIFAVAGNKADTVTAKERLARWLWCGVFGELYGGTTETRFSRDLPDVLDWISGGEVLPRTVVEAQFSPGRLLTLRTRGSAAYKGVYALLLREGAQDWRTGSKATVQHYFEESVDIHHIFPRAWAVNEKIPAARFDSIINKTPLSARTNRIIGGSAPSSYLPKLAKDQGLTGEVIEQQISTHFVDPALLKADDFDTFFRWRQSALLEQIGKAMGKAIDLEAGAELVPDDNDEYDEADE